MCSPLSLQSALAVLVFGVLFGFGFAVGGAIWRAISGK